MLKCKLLLQQIYLPGPLNTQPGKQSQTYIDAIQFPHNMEGKRLNTQSKHSLVQ